MFYSVHTWSTLRLRLPRIAATAWAALVATAAILIMAPPGHAAADYNLALKRAQYLLNGTVPTDGEYAVIGNLDSNYRAAVRNFLNHPNFYDTMLRYHEVLYGTGLDSSYITELVRDDIDNKVNKVATLTCNRSGSGDQRFRCFWASQTQSAKNAACPQSWELAVTVFWYPGLVAWVCPDVMAACGTDLSQCLISYQDQNAARNAELGTTEIFDSHFAINSSLSKQSAGLATAVVVANYPYTKILEPGLTAIDGAILHFMKQTHYFDMSKFNPPAALLDLVTQTAPANTRFQLVNTGAAANQAGALSTYGWLRRYEKDRSRANQTYQRFLCRQFTAKLPRVFPQDPGNLRTTPGCMGCHATLDPLADFFKTWGEGGNVYSGTHPGVATYFDNQQGSSLADLANIIRGDDAFATCTVTQAWEWLMGRGFYRDEADLRKALSSYFITVNYSFTELVYAITTHPAFLEGSRGDATVTDPLEEPPLGQPPGGNAALPCNRIIDFAVDIQPNLTMCTNCHFSGNAFGRQDLSTQAAWKTWGRQSVSFMASGQMPPGQAGPPLIGPVWDFKEAARCWLEQNP